MKWDSITGSPTFHPDAPNESVLFPLNNPAGAQNMKLSFKLLLGANDWWWAVDNIAVGAGVVVVPPKPAEITGQPIGGLFTAGQRATLTVTATGDEPITYQWQRGGTNIPGATASTYVINNVQAADAGSYTVAVQNSLTNLTSNPAVITVQAGGAMTAD